MRDYLKPLYGLLLFITVTGNGQVKQITHPNIIFIYIGDMGYSDPSVFGNREIKTPNIDRIAKGGIRFTNFYVASPICSPSRAAAITG